MKYSVLLPTRNGGKYLRYTIESILNQNHSDFELIVSDNANDDETEDVIHSFSHDKRMKAIRLASPVSVVDNWNAAYHQSSGEYILMMGDDDYLLPEYFNTMDAILERYADTDCVVHNGYSYVAPGSIRDQRTSFYMPHHFEFEPALNREQELDGVTKRSIVTDMFRWKIRIPLNMQTTIVSRRAAETLKGGFYQPPFPDHYALNALLLSNVKWVFSPERLVVVGTSPKSFGHYVYSNEQSSGLSYLGIDDSFEGRLPGNALLNGMHCWLDRLKANYPVELDGTGIDRKGYVRRQVYAWIQQMRHGDIGWKQFAKHMALLRPRDWLELGQTAFDAESWRRLSRLRPAATGEQAKIHLDRLRPLADVHNIAEFAARVPERAPVA